MAEIFSYLMGYCDGGHDRLMADANGGLKYALRVRDVFGRIFFDDIMFGGAGHREQDGREIEAVKKIVAAGVNVSMTFGVSGRQAAKEIAYHAAAFQLLRPGSKPSPITPTTVYDWWGKFRDESRPLEPKILGELERMNFTPSSEVAAIVTVFRIKPILESLIDSFVEQLSQVFMLRVFHVGTTGAGDIEFDHVIAWELSRDSSLGNCQVLVPHLPR
jgi:hypothetical protein